MGRQSHSEHGRKSEEESRQDVHLVDDGEDKNSVGHNGEGDGVRDEDKGPFGSGLQEGSAITGRRRARVSPDPPRRA